MRSLWSHIRLGFISNACTEILATHGNRVLCEQDIKTTITRSHVCVCVDGDRERVLLAGICINNLLGVVGTQIYSSFDMRFCVSLSLSRQLAMATNWNNFIQSGITHLIRNTHTHTNAHFACIYLLICVPKLLHPDPVLHRPHFAFIYGINYEASLPWFIFRLYLYLPTQLSTMYHTYIISSSILMSFANSSCFCFELSPLAKHYKLSELISSPNASWITLIIYKNCWAILYEIRGK